MPPTVPRKRLRADSSPAPKKKLITTTPVSRRKATLYDELDATSASDSKGSKAFLQSLDDSDDGSSLTDLSEVDFEDVPIKKKKAVTKTDGSSDDDDDDDEDEDIEFEDVSAPRTSILDAPVPTGDLELTLHRDTRISLTNPFNEKKGPSKVERRVRIATHCLHVQSLLWHNAIRNGWLCDPEVQAILMSHVPPRLMDEVDRWRKASGLDTAQPKNKKKEVKSHQKGRPETTNRKPRTADWGKDAERLEEGAVDMSHGDPLFRLVKSLSSWWKQRFRVTAPGLRKQGYMSLERIDRHTKAWTTTDHSDALYGERIRNLEEFRECAMDCAGSRDLGAQLFTGLLRALGLEVRMVASLQPLGFGWTKMEEAEPEKDTSTLAAIQRQKAAASATSESLNSAFAKTPPKNGPQATNKTRSKTTSTTPSSNVSRTRRPGRQPSQAEPGDQDELVLEHPDSDEESVVEVGMDRKQPDASSHDRDLDFPHYWTEILSPVTKAYLVVDPLVKKVVATNRELVESLEPRGKRADKARQVLAYVVGYSQDGTAKDVTVRYLKRQMLPGKTKGVRMPLEKVPIYNHKGKVKRYQHHDWFKVAMGYFARGTKKHPITEVDEREESTDLKPAQPEKKEVKEGEETLQYYKQSKEFCLERHLRREEALLPSAKPVKTFKNKARGKNKDADGDDESVYLRKDVVNVKSAETWHKQGRAPKPGEQPLKRVPYRAATTNRRREIAEAEALSGEKVLQGLYSFDQTDWIIPPPIKDGVIPKNEYGNIDLFAEHMCPEGAVHVPFRGAVKVCKRLGIDYAEAVVDFEFGHRMAVPVIQGVVCAEEYHDQVMEEIRKDEAERTRKEDEKKRKQALRLWSKFIKGLRIVERIKEDYGHIRDDVEVFGHKDGLKKTAPEPDADEPAFPVGEDEDMAGGFLPDGYEEEPVPEPTAAARRNTSTFFPEIDEDDESDPGDLVVDHGDEASTPGQPAASVKEDQPPLDGDVHVMDIDQVKEDDASEEEPPVVMKVPAKPKTVSRVKAKPKAKTTPQRKAASVATRRSTRQRRTVVSPHWAQDEGQDEDEDALQGDDFVASDDGDDDDYA